MACHNLMTRFHLLGKGDTTGFYDDNTVSLREVSYNFQKKEEKCSPSPGRS